MNWGKDENKKIGLIRRKGGIKRGSCWVGNCRCVLMI
jgi:hypothetical protein